MLDNNGFCYTINGVRWIEKPEANMTTTEFAAPQPGDRVLSVRQPYCSLLLLPGEVKVLENRTWAIPYRGRLWLHASKTAPIETCWGDVRKDWTEARPHVGSSYLPGILDLPRGVILGSVDLVACFEDGQRMPDDLCRRWDCEGPVCWHMTNPVLLDQPIPAKGMLGVWRYQS